MELKKILPQDLYRLLEDDTIEEIQGYEICDFHNFENVRKTIRSLSEKKFISNCKFIGSTNFHDIQIYCRLFFKDCLFEGSETDEVVFCKILKGNGDNTFFYFSSSNIFKLNVHFDAIQILNFEIAGQFERNVKITNCFENVTINGSPNQKSNFDQIQFYNIDKLNSLLIRDCVVSNFLAFDRSVPKSITICDGSYERINFNNIWEIPSLRIEAGNNNPDALVINSINTFRLKLSGEIRIKFATIKNLNFNTFENADGKLNFQGVKVIGEFDFIDSDLKGVKFNDVDFSLAHLNFDRSRISEANFTNIIWTPKHEISSKLKDINKEDKVQLYRSLTETYRQLKKVSLSESNNIEALKFYRNEMAAYWARVKLDKSEKPWNRFLIRVNKVTSNFGQSYLYPLFWMLGFHLVLCIIIWNLQANKFCTLGTNCTSDFATGISEYFSWLLPVFKAPEHWTAGSITTSFFMRVLNGFFIYHIIKATRKFVKD